MKFFGRLGAIVAILGLEAWTVMTLWNWVAVAVSGALEITFWMAVVAALLLNLLTGVISISIGNLKERG